MVTLLIASEIEPNFSACLHFLSFRLLKNTMLNIESGNKVEPQKPILRYF